MSMYPGGYYPPPPPQPYQGYPGYPGYLPPAAGPRNGLGIAALILGVAGLLATWSIIGGLTLGIAAAIMGFLAYRRVTSGQADNGAVAISGLVLGVLAIVVSLVFIPIWSGFMDEIGYSQYSECMQEAGQNQNVVNGCVQQFQNRIDDKLGTKSSG
ncbi:hypothetical protein ABIA30_003904 [Mycobacterium sp. MAA66]|uniref:DUF4190 domain-containing protein n=1 Tax=Mycobacterium sp. MAA66 TaxID=3156297 RepID=UPI003517F46B